MANAFEAEAADAAAHLQICYHKLAIPMRLCHVTKRLIKLKTNPYDSFLIHQGRHVALELKSLEEHESFPLRNIEDHQIEGLTQVLQAGGQAHILVNMRRKKGKSDNRAWYLPFEYWDELQNLLATRGRGGEPRKSVPYEFFRDGVLWKPLPRRRVENSLGETAMVWDLRVLLGLELPEDRVEVWEEPFPYDPDNPWALPPAGV